MSRNRITGGSGFWILVFALVFAIAYPKSFILIISIAVILILIIAIGNYKNLLVCKTCGHKGALVFFHRRIDGGPDRRYGNNPLVCPSCHANPHHFMNSNNSNDNAKTVVSCYYVNQPGMRQFKDCPDYPKNIGEKCKKCWISNA